MPICFGPGKGKDEVRDKAPAASPSDQEWREPPGYLGEAVRRAKRIASLGRAGDKPKDC